MKIFITLVIFSATILFAVSGLMGMHYGSWTTQDDVWFDADITFYERVFAEQGDFRPSPLHPLILFVWRPIGRSLAVVLQAAGAGQSSGMIAARTVLAGFAALGLASLWALASELGVKTAPRIALWAISLMATANLIACVPESYGISMGLLSASAAVMRSEIAPRRKAAMLVLMSVLCAGSTITNGVYPFAGLVYLLFRTPEAGGIRPPWLSKKRLRQLAISGGIIGFLVVASAAPWLPAFGRKFPNFRNHLLGWLHFRIYHEPARTICDWMMGVIYPITGPYPLIESGRIKFGSEFGGTWTWLHVVAAIAWCGMLVVGLVMGLKEKSSRLFVMGLVGWIGFNFAIHSVWGGSDNFLYSPHWSWALLTVAFMAARGTKSWVIFAVCAPIVITQFMTIRWLASAVTIQQP